MTDPVTPPNVARLSWADAARTKIRATLTDSSQVLTCEAGAVADFELAGTAGRVTDITCAPGGFTLTLSQAAPSTATLAYRGHSGGSRPGDPTVPETAWVTNQSGMGLLAFDHQGVGPM